MSNKLELNGLKKSITLPLIIAISAALSSAAFAADAVPSTENGFKMMNRYTVRAIGTDNPDFTSDSTGSQYYTQILESVGSYTFGNDYSMNWWLKFADGVWGQDFGQNAPGGTVVNESAEFQIDSLYGRVKNQSLDFRIGIVPLMFGNGYNLQTDGFTGSTVEFYPTEKSSLYLLASLVNENDYDDSTGYEWQDSRAYVDGNDGEGDEYLLGLQYGMAFDGGDAKVFYGTRFSDEVGDTAEWDIHTVGLSGNYTSGDFRFNSEASTFFGTASNDNDYTGLQLQLGATYNTSSGSIEGNFYYAKGADDGETQVAGLQKQGYVQPFQKGLGPSFDHNDDDLKMIGKPTSIFMIAQNSGVIGAGVNGLYMQSKSLTLAGGLMYLVPENKSGDSTLGYADYSDWTALSVVNVGVDYRFNQYVNIGAAASYKKFDSDDGSDLDDGMAVGASIMFNF